MSKSLGNYVGVNEPPNEMFGKLMSISDELMARLLSCSCSVANCRRPCIPWKRKSSWPAKSLRLITRRRSHKKPGKIGRSALAKKNLPRPNLPEFVVAENLNDAIPVVVAAYWKSFGITKSRTDVRRLIQQGSVQLDGEKITDPKSQLSLTRGQVLRLDKTHAVRIA